MERIQLKALGKINLGLDVLGTRADGYHLVRMIMQTVQLYDQVTIRKTEEPGIHLTCSLSFLPVDEHNIAHKAAALLMKEYPQITGVSIDIHKCIPVAAGMAGGSTDAAAVLYGMNQLFSLGISMERLKELGLQLGADVPYCLMRGTVLAEGIGEQLTRIPPIKKCPVLIAKPSFSVSTKQVYEKLDSLDHYPHPDIDGMMEALKAGDLDGVISCMGNVLEEVTIPMHPDIQKIKDFMMEHGAMGAMMTGSGPTVFGLFEKEEQAIAVKELMKEERLAKHIYVTGFYNL